MFAILDYMTIECSLMSTTSLLIQWLIDLCIVVGMTWQKHGIEMDQAIHDHFSVYNHDTFVHDFQCGRRLRYKHYFCTASKRYVRKIWILLVWKLCITFFSFSLARQYQSSDQKRRGKEDDFILELLLALETFPNGSGKSRISKLFYVPKLLHYNQTIQITWSAYRHQRHSVPWSRIKLQRDKKSSGNEIQIARIQSRN